MITLLRGRLIDRDPAGIVLETPGGVGYLVEVPLGVFERLPSEGSELLLHVELVVREESWSLYGFDTPGERLVFRRLMAASGVGPRIALAILSTLGPDRAVRALRDRDLAVLSSVPGIGRKKAERLVVEIGDRLDHLPVNPTERTAASPAADAVRALAALGYPSAQAELAVREASEAAGATDTAALVRRALTVLTRK